MVTPCSWAPLLSWLANIISLAVADWIFDGVTIDGWWSLILGAAVLGVANTIIKPFLTLLALPFIIITLGLALIASTPRCSRSRRIAPDFSIDGFWTYVGATIVVGIVNWLVHAGFRQIGAKPAVA